MLCYCVWGGWVKETLRGWAMVWEESEKIVVEMLLYRWWRKLGGVMVAEED